MDGQVYTQAMGEEWQCRFTVGVQTFDIGPRYETEEEAEWMSDMFCNAIGNMGATVKTVSKQ